MVCGEEAKDRTEYPANLRKPKITYYHSPVMYLLLYVHLVVMSWANELSRFGFLFIHLPPPHASVAFPAFLFAGTSSCTIRFIISFLFAGRHITSRWMYVTWQRCQCRKDSPTSRQRELCGLFNGEISPLVIIIRAGQVRLSLSLRTAAPPEY